MEVTNTFKLGSDMFPKWFVDNQDNIQVKYNYGKNLILLGLDFTSNGKRENAKVGDTLMYINDTVLLIKAEDAEKYMS